MRKLLFVFLFFASLTTFSQVIISSAHMPQSGDTMRYSLALLDTSVLSNFQKAGANQTWDMSSLVAQRSGLSEFLASSQTPYSGSVPNRIGEKLADTVSLGGIQLLDVYNFYNSSSSEFALDYRGVSLPTGFPPPLPPALTIAQSFNDKDEIYQFPLNYQDIDSSSFNFVFSNQLVGAYYSSTGTRVNQVDAWGTLSTPFGTFNCLRVVTDISSYDSISFGGNDFGLNTVRREYKWLSPQFSIPALTVSGSLVAGTFIPTTVQYRDSVRKVPSVLAPIALFTTDTTGYYVGDVVSFQNLTVSLLPSNYKWNISPITFQYQNPSGPNSDSIKVVFTDTGYYDVQLIARNSEGRDTLTRSRYLHITSTNSIIENTQPQIAWIYPNPVKRGSELRLFLEKNIEIDQISMLDANGKLIKKIPRNRKSREINFPLEENIPPGIYFIQLISEKNKSSLKLIVQ